jgi:hypothetical protein
MPDIYHLLPSNHPLSTNALPLTRNLQPKSKTTLHKVFFIAFCSPFSSENFVIGISFPPLFPSLVPEVRPIYKGFSAVSVSESIYGFSFA